jgi:hypothetical protein
MEEKDIISKIEKLKDLKPSKDWVFSAKREVFKENGYSVQLKPGFSFNFFMKPAFAFAVLSIAVLVTGFFYYSYNLDGLKTAQDKYDEKLAELEVLTPALENLQASLFQARTSLNNTRLSDPREVLEVGKNIDSVVKEGEKVLDEVKRVAVDATTSEDTPGIASVTEVPESEVLTSLNDAERAVQELEESYKVFIGRVIEDVERWYLGPLEEEKLERAKEYYERGEYNKALDAIYSISYPEYQAEY